MTVTQKSSKFTFFCGSHCGNGQFVQRYRYRYFCGNTFFGIFRHILFACTCKEFERIKMNTNWWHCKLVLKNIDTHCFEHIGIQQRYHIAVLGTSKLADIRNRKMDKDKVVGNVSPYDPMHIFQLQIKYLWLFTIFLFCERQTHQFGYIVNYLFFSYHLYFNHRTHQR